ncbi:protein FAR1-RELATED SEQUENCE 5-like [Silene latifolia]|uniref:protein FAR1-RELATED SEQUENCE 5-like n=1 Tax=Silene latifolia TaxID=37657 RepID=UPI003D77EC35
MAMKNDEMHVGVEACGLQCKGQDSLMGIHNLALGDDGGAIEDLRTETLEDHIKLVNRLRLKVLEEGGAEAVIKKLTDDAATNPNLVFSVRRDASGCVVGLFWCDSRMRDDYKTHRDVIVFGTSYSSNKYKLLCAPFVGVINPCYYVMFGCAFIADEKTDTFVWLLETFKEAMSNKSPGIIVTERDLAIANAIRQVFPQAKHQFFQFLEQRMEENMEN